MKNNNKPDAFIVTKDDGDWDLVNAGVMDKYAIKTDVDSDGSKQIYGDGWDYNSFYEPLYDPEQLAELLELNTYHSQCCDVVSRDAGGLAYTVNPVSDEKEINSTEENKVRAFLDNIKPSINQLLYQRHYDRRSMGYGAIEIIRQGRSKTDITNLSHIPSQHLRRHRDGIRVKQQIGTKTVWFVIYGKNKDNRGKLFDVDAETGEIVQYNRLAPENRANEILWSMDYTPKSQFYGLAKIVTAIPTIYGDLSRSNYNTSFFKNYGMPAFAVMVSGDFEDYDKDPEDPDYDITQTLKYKISQQIKEVMKNPHSAVTILVPSEGEEGNVEIKLQPLSIETKEASFRFYRRDNRDEVLVAHRVPGYRIGINETGNLGGSNSEDANKLYKNSVIEPLQADDEFDINNLLRTEFGISTCRFAISEIDIRDLSSDMVVAEKMFQMASMRPIDIINHFGERFGLKADDNPYLYEYYLNGQPLDNLWAGGGADPPGTDTVLSQLETDLLTEVDEDETESEDGLEGAAIKNAFNRFTNRLSDTISRRKST